MGGFVGGQEELRRIRKHEKRRDSQKKQFQDEQARCSASADAAGLRQFGTGQAEVLEDAFKSETVGLVSKADFISKRFTLAERHQDAACRKKRNADDSEILELDRRAARKAKQSAQAKLSFLSAEEDDEDCSHTGPTDAATDETDQEQKSKVGKDPTIATEFLPDKDRSAAEQDLREQLKSEWRLRQQVIKNEPLEITYSYWDGTGHRRKVAVRKGDTVADFLRAIREQLSPDFRELRGVSATDLMYIKEDIILTHELTFYDLIVRQARGKSGPLFHFDVHEDVRLQNDARVEKDESHAGKVVERHWYNRNKHIFPASRWEHFDPATSFGTYTVHGE